MERWLTYDHISLIPTQVSTLEHRADVDTSVQFGPLKLQVPIIAAPMPDVCDYDMAKKLAELGVLGIINRFQPGWGEYGIWHEFSCGIAKSIKTSDSEIDHYINNGHFNIVCLDTANGASEMVRDAIGRLKDKYPGIFIIAGNVASAETFYELESWGADAIRVGIAGGSVCETRTETGVYSPMATVISKIDEPIKPKAVYNEFGMLEYPNSIFAQVKRNRKALLIADGGIKTPADMCKALALGADVVMMGGALAGTDESPGPIIRGNDGKLYKRLAGAASYITQKESTGKKPSYVEGAETLVEYRGPVKDVIDRFAAGLRSSMSYMNAKDLTEYRANAKIVEIS